jgi:hypothetical protein
MPIADVELIMMALAAVLATQHFPLEVDDWEGLPAASCRWQAWKVAFHLAHLKRQCQLQASGGGKLLGGAHAVIPTAAPTIDRIGAALKNLVLAALNDSTILQQLTAANLALTASVTLLMAANKKARRHVGSEQRWRNTGGSTGFWERSLDKEAFPFPRELLLDPRSSSQPEPHECNLRNQGFRTQG